MWLECYWKQFKNWTELQTVLTSYYRHNRHHVVSQQAINWYMFMTWTKKNEKQNGSIQLTSITPCLSLQAQCFQLSITVKIFSLSKIVNHIISMKFGNSGLAETWFVPDKPFFVLCQLFLLHLFMYEVPIYSSCLRECYNTALLRSLRNVLWTSSHFPLACGMST